MIQFHKVLIGSAIAFCAGFALWSVWRGSIAIGLAFAVLALALSYYLRHLRRFIGR